MRDEADITHAMASTVCRGFASQPRLGLLCSDALYAVLFMSLCIDIYGFITFESEKKIGREREEKILKIATMESLT